MPMRLPLHLPWHLPWRLQSTVLVVMLLGFCLGCRVKTAFVETREIEPEVLREFSLPRMGDSIVLGGNQIFLWPRRIDSRRAARVFTMSRQIDQMTKRRKRLEGRRGRLLDDPESREAFEKVRVKKREFNSKRAALNSAQSNLKDRRRKLTAAQASLAEEQAKANPNSDEVARLQDLVLRYQGEIDDLERNRIPELLAERDAVQQQLDVLVEELNQILNKNKTELDRISGEIADADQRGGDMLREITTSVVWYDMSQSRITFRTLEDGTISATIYQWILDAEEGPRTFSTEPGAAGVPTITNLQYKSLGGGFDFDVLVFEKAEKVEGGGKDEIDPTRLRETFSFHVSRNGFQDGKGKICFLGKVFRKRVLPDGTVEIRRGIAKLMDSNS